MIWILAGSYREAKKWAKTNAYVKGAWWYVPGAASLRGLEVEGSLMIQKLPGYLRHREKDSIEKELRAMRQRSYEASQGNGVRLPWPVPDGLRIPEPEPPDMTDIKAVEEWLESDD